MPSRYEINSKKVKENPNDADALYELYLCYCHGWGITADENKAERYLQDAFKLGNGAAKSTLERRIAESNFNKQRAILDLQWEQEAKSIFVKREKLNEAIEAEIFPALISIRTQTGITGTGFFQHSSWLASNAHILPSQELLPAVRIVDYHNKEVVLNAERSYHRPNDKIDVPDIVIIETASRPDDNRKCLPTSFTDDEGYGVCTFYIDVNTLKSNTYKIVFLREKSKSN
ncbi:MAG TPA: SEL1-like repeat protein, partial [Gammaproteobacteria bacterium]|nr:SEL1-like repeat protein [Gammaproteobacteria bacterium]